MSTTKNNSCAIDEIFLPDSKVREIVSRFGTPLFLYDEKGLCQSAKSLLSLFPVEGWKHYFPLWKCPHRAVLKALAATGMGARCQTPEELKLALECGFRGENILFSAVWMTEEVAACLREENVILAAAGSLALEHELPPKVLLQAWVPRGKNTIGPVHNHRPGVGFSKEELPAALSCLYEKGVSESGILIRYDSSVTNENFLAQQLAAAQKLCQSVQDSPVPLSRIHLDGGFNPGRNRTKLLPDNLAAMVNCFLRQAENGQKQISFCLGDLVAEPNCLYLAKVLGSHARFSPMVVTDANSGDLLLQGTDHYHHISVLGKRGTENRRVCDIMGRVARAGDWLGKCRILPVVEPKDVLVFHDAGSSVSPAATAPILLVRKNGTVSVLQERKEN